MSRKVLLLIEYCKKMDGKVLEYHMQLRQYRMFNAFPLDLTSIQKSPTKSAQAHGDSSQSPYPYPWESTWEFPYLQQPCRSPNDIRTRGNGDIVAFHQICLQRNAKSMIEVYIHSSEKSCFAQKTWSRFALILFKLHEIW